MAYGLAKSIRQSHGVQQLGLLHFSAWHAVRGRVLAYSLWATAVWLLNRKGWMPMVSSGVGSLVNTLSMVTGLLVSFRASSSYERWSEGRRVWANIQSTTRTFIRLLVFALPPPATSLQDSHSAAFDEQRASAIKEMAGLVLAFPYACMYRLRDQAGLERKELQSLLPYDLLAAYRSTPASQRSRPSISADPSFVQHSKAAEADRAIANLNAPPSASRFLPRSLPTGEPTNLPLSLVRAIQAYVTGWHETKLPSRDSPSEGSSVLDGVTFAAATNALKEFTDELTALERIRDTPIPLILNIQLQVLLLVYVAAVPLQLVRSWGVWSVAATAVTAACFFGVDRAAEELSDPFGEEPNDLPVARFCADLHREYLEMLGEGGGSSGNAWEPASMDKLSASVKKEE